MQDALTSDGWPNIDSVRGQVLFVLLNVDDVHASDYTANYTTLAGRAMFARVTPAQSPCPGPRSPSSGPVTPPTSPPPTPPTC